MLKPVPLASVLLLFLAAGPIHAAPKIRATDNGVVINNGAMGSFTFPVPGLRTGPKDYGGQKPVATVDGNVITCKYQAGGELKITVDPATSTATYRYSGVPQGATAFVFGMQVPISFKNGGQFAFGEKALQPFPETFEKQIVADGGYSRVALVDPVGEAFAIVTPLDYQQIQDNRAFNWNVYSYIYNYTFKAHGGQTQFQFKFTDYKEKAPAGGSTAAAEAPKKTFIVDRYGQSARKNYPGKITSDEELRADGIKQLAEKCEPDPKLDSYGGLKGSGEQYKLKKTGFFALDKVGDRHVFVTPEGNMFFQLSVCGIASTDDHTLVKGREKTYEWIPKKDDERFLTAWRQSKPDWGSMSFYCANWIRKFDKPFTVEEWTGQVVDRLRCWGFNSAGAFSANTQTMRDKNFPIVSFLPITKDKKYNLPDKVGADDLLDPFSEGVAEALDKSFAKLADRASDPLLIGYMMGNEQHFENLPKLIPSYKASQVAAKRKLMEGLKAKYGDIAKFNTAWNPAKPFADWESAGEEPLFIRTDVAAADMKDFYRLYLETFYSMVTTTFRKYDKNHLLIGSRWTPHTANNEDLVRVAGKYLDVVSINYYTYQIEKNFLDKVYNWSGGKPLMFTEWYYSSTEQGLAAHKEVKDQEERGKGYRNYIEQSAATPYVIGSQWFIYTDQSITGRFFSGFHGEGNNTGFVDVADRPYQPLVDAAKLTHARVYDVMLGKEKPYRFEDNRFTGEGAGGKLKKVVAGYRAVNPLKLDGTTAGWPGVPAEPIEPGRLVVGLPNPNLRGDFRVCWDDKNLYFHVQVKDPSPMKNEHKGKNLWNADAIELFVGAKELDKDGPLMYSDRQILIGAKDPTEVYIAEHEKESESVQAIAVKDVSGDGYVIQAFIPWTALDIPTPKAGQEILFDVAIDNTDDGLKRTHQLAWNGTSKNSGDRTAWGRIRLE
jgi:hypothetical protein